ncbi:MAG TPA: DUF1349 domain-containing protein [Actinophytocola sp.]|uniref:DUF1349 domain-containing protein n=1 Tax=Actinophytocola sp. TaxID=1872138 RepID=UPI002DDCF500|nr:DUF1349 domain-containing protein [Actinophytocola sp.]HEV2778387.1 DUF1349 domain-containing protein [Actinophytocola sp.]
MVDTFGSGGWEWLNPPPRWTADGKGLTVTAGQGTDFWRVTHYGYIRDSGHVLGRRFTGDLRMTATFSADYRERYDQAGLMIRVDERTWIKAGLELDERHLVSVVVTRETSDWSMTPLPAPPEGQVTIELERSGDAVFVRYGTDGRADIPLRLAALPADAEVLAGPMCAAPTGSGFEVRFTELLVHPG